MSTDTKSTGTKSTSTETAGAKPHLLAQAQGIRVSFGGPQVLADVGLAVSRGEVVSLVGPNGSGKTTLIRTLLGLVRPDAGTVWLRPGIRIGYMPQRLSVEPFGLRDALATLGKGLGNIATGKGDSDTS